MAKIHMMLQGKGGVGKSVIAATLAQYKASKGQKPLCIDIAPGAQEIAAGRRHEVARHHGGFGELQVSFHQGWLHVHIMRKLRSVMIHRVPPTKSAMISTVKIRAIQFQRAAELRSRCRK